MKNKEELDESRWWLMLASLAFSQLAHAFDNPLVGIILALAGLAFGIASILLSEILGQCSNERLYFKDGELFIVEEGERNEK